MMENYKPSLGFLGVGWIGRNRMEAVAEARIAEISVIADPSEEILSAINPNEQVFKVSNLNGLLSYQPDAVVIATPSALHTQQCLQALNHQTAVFCQKPLGRNTQETAEIIETAKKQNLLLGVDFSYRFTCFKTLYQLISEGQLGKIHAIEMCFHNAYGPDKEWFYQKELSGGGCVLDLGVHLIDLAFWCLGNKAISVKNSLLYAKGKRLKNPVQEVEDYAIVLMEAEDGTALQLNCSWNLPAGKEAEIYFKVYGEYGGAAFQNLNGSFYDFEVLKFEGTKTIVLESGKADWGGKAIIHWCKQLAISKTYHPEIENALKVSQVIDAIYEKA